MVESTVTSAMSHQGDPLVENRRALGLTLRGVGRGLGAWGLTFLRLPGMEAGRAAT